MALRPRTLWIAGAAAALAAACVGLFAYLLARFPYGGLYGQDSYAYYYQALAIWQGITGEPPTPSPFSANGLQHWPVGYHLHIIAGFLLGGEGPGGGRAITLFMAVAAPVLLYLLVGELWVGSSLRARAIAGLCAGTALPLVATYTRMGLSLMSDVPDLFWGVLAIFCFVKAWPVPALRGSPARPGKRALWALAAGAALGVAVLLRYASGLLVGPLLIYLAVRWYTGRAAGKDATAPSIFWLVPGFVLALLPEAAYLLTYDPGFNYADWASGWSLANIFSRTLTSPDGTVTYSQPMIVFFLLSPLFDSATGFFSFFYLPALLLGLATLLRQGRWALLSMLLTWWLLPALFLSGTPYQAHRLALIFIPALACIIGVGVATAVEWTIAALRGGLAPARIALGIAAMLLLASTGLGALQGWRSVRQWAAIHASFQSNEQQVAALARQAAGPAAQGVTPHVLSFGITAALYYYTSWPILDFYNGDEPQIESFMDVNAPRVLVVPEQSMSTQWANTPSGERWRWIQGNYSLHLAGKAGDFSVYSVQGRRTAARPHELISTQMRPGR